MEDYVDRGTHWSDGMLALMQVKPEILGLMRQVQQTQPKVVVEIGTAAGGTLYLWTRVAADDATIISLDLPQGPFGGGYSAVKIPFYKSFARANQRIHLLRADSHQQSSLEKLKKVLNGRLIDFLYIDGDHSYAGCKQDWEMYGPLVRPGGLVAFHDVQTDYVSARWGDVGVKRVWEEIKGRYEFEEFIEPQSPYGIGVLHIPAAAASSAVAGAQTGSSLQR